MTTTAQFIESFEGRRHDAYLDSVKVPTIGAGHTGPEVHLGLTWTDAQIDAALAADIAKAQVAIKRLIKGTLSDNAMTALTSFVFNLGGGALASSTLLIRINSGDQIGAAHEFPKWDHAGQVELKGLLIRRFKEAAMFLS